MHPLKEKVLFLCTHNAARSQMTEGLLRDLRGNKYEVFSAGTEPTSINPYVVKAMEEIGISLSNHRSKFIQEYRDINFNHVVTLCDKSKELCSFYYGARTYEQSFPDPLEFTGSEEEILAQVRTVRDSIKEYIINTFIR
ncbi:hypothetical protein P22_1656 [Propionispora sp. 2/2-37]|uniref:arsenate reductase ArsC n=1 Tax=Propionispora sp. 2/2-37 TaxID=1677858 RepID=UPI0006BB9586|nr:arsenate reductase ArsC [Propionispora sp. 2/2-37]CUH95583.1 hypothetical protein P22_1656 [Propionispora sp. 2/2-37]